jgi:protein phosphatase
MTLRLKAGAATDVGRVRQVNQDSFLVLDDRGLYAVADGMGGHQGGEVASQLAIEALRSTYVEGAVDALAAAIEEANLRIHEEGEADPNLQGMGTTVVAVAVVPDEQGDETTGSLLVANVGDSRAYLFRDDSLTQLTEDHSMVGDLLREGRITEAEAEVHPQRNIVTRVLGVYDQVDIDLWPVDAVRGDRLLLCSDGLFNEVAGDQIASVLRRLADPQEAAAELVRRAIEGGGRDNVTVLIVDVVDDGGVAQAASSSLAGAASGLDSGQRDLAGFASARDEIIDAPEPEPERERRRLRRPKGERVPLRSRLTWRVAAFAILLLAVVGGAIATIQWYGTSAYYLGVQHGEVVIFQGRPGGVLWIDPKVVAHSGIQVAEVPDNYRDRLVKGREQEQSSRREADRVVSNIERDIAATTTTTTTTTLPPDPNAPTTVVAP